MNKAEITEILRKENILELLDDGPTAIVVSKGNRDLLLQIKRVDDNIEVVTGKIIRHKTRISINDIKD